jgi:ribosomal protein L37E
MDKCSKCSKTVYPTERFNALGKAWHKACFKCTTCNATLQLGSEQQHDGLLYCKRCHQANFGPGGYGFGGGGGALSSYSWNTNVHEYKPPKEPVKSNQQTKFCSQCGNKLPSIESKFCSQCGNKSP